MFIHYSLYAGKNFRAILLTLSFLFLSCVTSEKVFAQSCNVTAGVISTTSNTVVCSGDGQPDIVNINLSGNVGTHSAIIFILAFGEIAEIHQSLSIDFEGRSSRTYIVRQISYEPGLTGLEVGGNIANLSGCYALSTTGFNVTALGLNGGVLTTQSGLTDTTICVNDGKPDVLELRITNTDGIGALLATTDLSGTITALDFSPGPNFEGSGGGVVRLYFIRFCGDFITGVTVGMNIDDIPALTDASNPVTITKKADCCFPEVKTCDNKVLMCINNVSTCVPPKRVNRMLQEGGTLGGCTICGLSATGKAVTDFAMQETESAFKIYPNPAKSSFHVTLPVTGNTKLELRTVTGQLLWTKNIYVEEGNSVFISVSDLKLKTGMYYLGFIHNNQRAVKPVVIME